MSRGLGKVQRAIMESLTSSAEAVQKGWIPPGSDVTEVGWLAQRVYREVHAVDDPPEPLPRAFIKSMQRAICHLEQSGKVCAGLAPRWIAPRNYAHTRMGLDLTKWVWLPSGNPPKGWCCPLPPDHAVNRGNTYEEPASGLPPAPAGNAENGGWQQIDLSVATPSFSASPPPPGADAHYDTLVDACYKVEPLASELRAITDPMTIADKICAFLKFREGADRQGVIRMVLRRAEEAGAPC